MGVITDKLGADLKQQKDIHTFLENNKDKLLFGMAYNIIAIPMIIIIIIGTIECIIVDYFFKVITAFFTIIHLSPIC